jgi:hypothetical protein
MKAIKLYIIVWVNLFIAIENYNTFVCAIENHDYSSLPLNCIFSLLYVIDIWLLYDDKNDHGTLV